MFKFDINLKSLAETAKYIITRVDSGSAALHEQIILNTACACVKNGTLAKEGDFVRISFCHVTFTIKNSEIVFGYEK